MPSPINLLDMTTRFAVAIILAAILGFERVLAGKPAGMRTYAMVAIGSCAFIVADILASAGIFNFPGANPIVVEQAVVSGIGFIGAGLIIFQQNKVSGVTTAAGLWVAAALGVAAGFGFYTLALVITIAALIIFTVLKFFEKRLGAYFAYSSEDENENAPQAK